MDFIRKPIRIHKGKNYFRYFSIFILIMLILLSLYVFKVMGFVMLAIIIPSLAGLLLIAFPRLLLFTDGFLIEKKCKIDSFSTQNYYKYTDILTVEYSPGRTDWAYLFVVAIFGSGGFGGNSKADQLILTTRDKKRHTYNRFGKKEEFMKIVKIIESNL